MFIAVYTNKVKDYCDRKFFDRLDQIGGSIYIADNTTSMQYTNKLRRWGYEVDHIPVDTTPKETLFQRNVQKSVNHLRDKFLDSKHKYFVIIESDVLVPVNVLDLFEKAISMADDWGAIGGLYHMSAHDFSYRGIDRLVKTQCVFSGCTIYSREMIQLFNFRWDERNPGMFPDACWSRDVLTNTNKTLYNYPMIVCEHMDKGWGDRGHKDL